MKKEPGTVNMAVVKEAINSIEFITKQFKLRRITSEQYVNQIQDNLSRLTTQRDYSEYLKSIGQL